MRPIRELQQLLLEVRAEGLLLGARRARIDPVGARGAQGDPAEGQGKPGAIPAAQSQPAAPPHAEAEHGGAQAPGGEHGPRLQAVGRTMAPVDGQPQEEGPRLLAQVAEHLVQNRPAASLPAGAAPAEHALTVALEQRGHDPPEGARAGQGVGREAPVGVGDAEHLVVPEHADRAPVAAQALQDRLAELVVHARGAPHHPPVGAIQGWEQAQRPAPWPTR